MSTTEQQDDPATEAPARPDRQHFRAELRDAVSARTVLLVLGVLVLQLGFVLSYVGAFHAPAPHRIPVAVVAPAPVSAKVTGQLDALPGSPLRATAVADEAAARRLIDTGATSAALLVDPAGSQDRLLVASAGGTSVATAVQQVISQVEARQQRTATVTDVIPPQSGDGRGLTGFYLVVGWIVGGYLVAALLGVAKGARPATTRRAVIRLLAVLPYAVASGLGGMLVVDPLLGALTGHFLALSGLGALLVLATAAVTMALQVLFDTLGIGLTVLLFVVLGNPSAGGAYQSAMLPTFWRTVSDALPNGAGTDTVRRIVYLGSHGIAGHLLLITGYAAAGVAVTLLATHLRGRRSEPAVSSTRTAAAPS